MPGIVEKQDRLGAVDERAPRWIVVSTGYTWRFFDDPNGGKGGHVTPASLLVTLEDADATHHIRSLFAGTSGYGVAHIAHYAGTDLLPPRDLHASLACDVWIFERR